jgi:heptosyltransferase II
MKILVIQTAFIGDLILTLPMIQTIKKNIPSAKIDVLCIPYTKSILDNNPYINNVIVFDKHQKRKITDLKILSENLDKQNYELAIIPHRSIRSGLIAMMAKIKKRIGFKKPFFDCIYTETIDYPFGIHEIDRNLSLLKSFGFKEYSRIPELFPPGVTELTVSNLLASNNIDKDFVCIAPGSKWYTKRWLPEYYKILSYKFISSGLPVILIGGNEDGNVCNFITIGTNHIINTCGKLSLQETALLIKKSVLLISNDSAPVHLAGAVNTPVIDIYGPTTPEIGFYPISDKYLSIQIEELNCRPCGIHGGNKCPVGSFDCMKNILPDYVFEKAISIINE